MKQLTQSEVQDVSGGGQTAPPISGIGSPLPEPVPPSNPVIRWFPEPIGNLP